MNFRVFPPVLALFIASGVVSPLLGQGSLTPPGAPAQSMKSLDQVEARTIINAVNCAGDSGSTFIIHQSGSYYLTGNILGGTGQNGIQVMADHVTIDLNGFTIGGVSGSLTGIITGGSHRGTRIVNGHVSDWPSAGIRLVGAGSVVSDVTVLNSGNAIVLDQQASTQILRCVARDINVASVSDACFTADQIDTCTVHNLSGGANVSGINGYATVVNCGVQTIGGTSVSGITCTGTVTNCSVLNVSGTTISGIVGSLVERCLVSSVGTVSTTSVVGISGSVVQSCKVSGMNQGAGSTSSVGISAFSCADSQVFNVTFNSSAFTWGIKASQNVQGCSVTNVHNSGAGSGAGIGLNFFSNSTGLVTSSRVDGSEIGIFTTDRCQVLNCVSVGNDSHGIQVGQRCRVIDCTTSTNGLVTAGMGITTDIRTEVSRCSANDNTGDGIAILGGCVVANCTSENNGTGSGASAVGSGVRVASGAGSRIESNHTRDNHRYGIEAGAADVIVHNTSGNNGLGQYLPSSGTNFGPVQFPATATNPAANF